MNCLGKSIPSPYFPRKSRPSQVGKEENDFLGKFHYLKAKQKKINAFSVNKGRKEKFISTKLKAKPKSEKEKR